MSIAKLRYTLNSVNQDILIVGSSRAQHHFNPDVISRETGLSAYNCGFGGQGLTFSFIQLSKITDRYNPKLVILEVSPEILLDPESNEKLKILLPYAKKDTLIRKTLIKENHFENLKLISDIYPYNSKVLNLLKASFGNEEDLNNGYFPLSNQLDTTHNSMLIRSSSYTDAIPEDKYIYLKRIIELCKIKAVPLFIIISPYYSVNDQMKLLFEQIKSLCQNDGVDLFFNYSTYEGTYLNPSLFQDNAHLNGTGADLFTSEVSKEISLYLSGSYRAHL